jgi:hypothetical protein
MGTSIFGFLVNGKGIRTTIHDHKITILMGIMFDIYGKLIIGLTGKTRLMSAFFHAAIGNIIFPDPNGFRVQFLTASDRKSVV